MYLLINIYKKKNVVLHAVPRYFGYITSRYHEKRTTRAAKQLPEIASV